MKYEFSDPSGNVVEIDFPMREAPSIRDIILRDGVELVRVPSMVQVDPATNRSQYPYVSQALPRNLAGCKTASGGKPIVASKRHEREIMARHGYQKD